VIGFTPGELDQIRETTQDDLPDQATIYPRVLTDVGSGSLQESWGTPGPTVAARIGPSGIKTVEQPVAGRTGAVMFFVITLALGTPISPADQIQIGATRYYVVGYSRQSRPLSLRVAVVEVV
jgi:hypothetical protein